MKQNTIMNAKMLEAIYYDSQIEDYSLFYIKHSMNVYSNEVPYKLLINWVCEITNKQDLIKLEESQSYRIFQYALNLYTQHKPLLENVGKEGIIELFLEWQICILFILMQKINNPKFVPFKLFDFENYEKLEFLKEPEIETSL